MKNYIFTITVITTMWQPLCVGMLNQETKPTLESLFSIAAISHDICKTTFENTTKPIHKDDVTKYLLVKQAMQNNGFKFLSVNTELSSSHFQLPTLFPDDSDVSESCNAYSYLKNFKTSKDIIKNMAAHSDLPPIIALDTYIHLKPTKDDFKTSDDDLDEYIIPRSAIFDYDPDDLSQCFDVEDSATINARISRYIHEKAIAKKASKK